MSRARIGTARVRRIALAAIALGVANPALAQSFVVISGDGNGVGICTNGSGVTIGGIVAPCAPANQTGSVRIGNNETGAVAPSGQQDVFIGNGAGRYMTGANNVVIGTGAGAGSAGATSSVSNVIALGSGARAAMDASMALGAHAVAVNAGDVALGTGSVTAAVNPVAGTTINGVAYQFAGTSPTSLVSIGAVGSERQLANVAAGRIDAASTDAINGSQLYATNQAIVALGAVAGRGWDMTAGAVGTGVVTGTSLQTIAPGDMVSYQAGDNLVVTQSGNTLTYALNPVLTGLTQISVAGGPTIDANGIHNLAAGVAPTDGVNVSQLSAAIGSVAISFAGNSGTPVSRGSGQTLAIQGTATTAGSYSGGNVRTVTDPATGAVNIQIADAPKFGGVTINDGGSGRITGVANGTIGAASQDAVNGSQLFALGTSMANSLGGSSRYDPVTGTVTAGLAVGGNTYNDVQSALQAVNMTANAGWNVTTRATGTGTVSGSTVQNIAAGSTATFTAGDNIAITQVGREVQVAVNPDLKVSSVAIANGPTINGAGITLRAGDTLDMGGNTITNVAPGVNAMDAVNVGQLNAGLTTILNSANGYTDARVTALSFDLSRVRRDANAGTAAAMAMGAVPQAFEPGMGLVGGGISTWMGEQAFAIGLSKASDNGRVIVKATGTINSRGKGGGAAGIGFQF